MTTVCQIDGCSKQSLARGCCNAHYKKLRKHGDPLYTRPAFPETCSKPGCQEPYSAKGLCRRHYSNEFARRPEQRAKKALYETTRLQRPEARDKRRAYDREWKRQARKTEKYKAYKKAYESQGKGLKTKLANNAFRKALKKRATPAWLTATQKAEIRSWYQTCPPGYHVDHIIPLRGENVSGLHVPWNLQHLPAVENIKKGNKLVYEGTSKSSKAL